MGSDEAFLGLDPSEFGGEDTPHSPSAQSIREELAKMQKSDPRLLVDTTNKSHPYMVFHRAALLLAVPGCWLPGKMKYFERLGGRVRCTIIGALGLVLGVSFQEMEEQNSIHQVSNFFIDYEVGKRFPELPFNWQQFNETLKLQEEAVDFLIKVRDKFELPAT